ncbi:hypothetical protein ACJ73_01828 [Blastomyces percursus]|uniref:GH18 domain-containing protein n=1 Tax=Blastomyces percursus TaxID=1658174 RepID=A0A1J9R301_9EURO|nr:hypothetical protein ACJ73_01828 [Blastomyces percursus]
MPGLCTLNSGTLSDYEIHRVMKEKSPDVFYDQESGVNWITWDKDQWVSYDDGRTLKQKADFGNKLCLAGPFAWAIDLGGPATLKNSNDLTAGDSRRGADPRGGDGGSGEVYISPEIFKEKDPGIACVPPCTFIMPPISLNSPATITLPLYTTSLEVAWPTTQLVTLPGGSGSTSTGLVRTIQTTTLTIPPITTSKISLWNWKVTDLDASSSRYTPISSILPPPFIITEKLPEGWVQGNSPKPTPDNGNPGAIISDGGDSKSGSDDHHLSGHDRHSNPFGATSQAGHSAPESAAPDPTGANRGINSLDGKKKNPTFGPDGFMLSSANRGKNSQAATADTQHTLVGIDNPSLIGATGGNNPMAATATTRQPTRGSDGSRHGWTTEGHENDHVITVAIDDSILNFHFPSSTTNSPVTTRTITPLPFPYTIGTEEDDDDDDDDDNKTILPVVTFTKGPPDPLCNQIVEGSVKAYSAMNPVSTTVAMEKTSFPRMKRQNLKTLESAGAQTARMTSARAYFASISSASDLTASTIYAGVLSALSLGAAAQVHSKNLMAVVVTVINPVGVLGCTATAEQADVLVRNVLALAVMGPIAIMGVAKVHDAGPLRAKERAARRDSALDRNTRSDKTEHFTTTNTSCHTVTACSVQPTTITTTTTMEKLPVHTGVGVTMTPPDTNEHYMALAQYLVYKIHSRDATRMYYIPEVATPTTTAKPKKSPTPAKLKCFGSGSSSHRAEMIRAIEGFCNENKGRMVRKEDGKIIAYYSSRCFGPGACFVEVNISVELINDCNPFELDGGSPGDLCGHSFRQPVDKCDTRGQVSNTVVY